MIEIDSDLYYVASAWERVHVKPVGRGEWLELDLGDAVRDGLTGIYLYVNSPTRRHIRQLAVRGRGAAQRLG